MTQLDALGMYVWKNNGKDKMKRRNNQHRSYVGPVYMKHSILVLLLLPIPEPSAEEITREISALSQVVMVVF